MLVCYTHFFHVLIEVCVRCVYMYMCGSISCCVLAHRHYLCISVPLHRRRQERCTGLFWIVMTSIWVSRIHVCICITNSDVCETGRRHTSDLCSSSLCAGLMPDEWLSLILIYIYILGGLLVLKHPPKHTSRGSTQQWAPIAVIPATLLDGVCYLSALGGFSLWEGWHQFRWLHEVQRFKMLCCTDSLC